MPKFAESFSNPDRSRCCLMLHSHNFLQFQTLDMDKICPYQASETRPGPVDLLSSAAFLYHCLLGPLPFSKQSKQLPMKTSREEKKKEEGRKKKEERRKK